jgi:hypothetical protein
MMNGIGGSVTMKGIGACMVNIIHTGLSEAGHSELVSLVERGDNDHPLCNWSKLGRAPTIKDVRTVHAAILRAYETCAPDEIGEGPGQFTSDPTMWFDAIKRARRPMDCGSIIVIPPLLSIDGYHVA